MIDHEQESMGTKRRVLMITEGTFPHVIGGVSTWCDLLINGLSEVTWEILPLLVGEVPEPRYELPSNASLLPAISLWNQDSVPRGKLSHRGAQHREIESSGMADVPGAFASGLLGWEEPLEPLVEALVRCREYPELVRPTFRSKEGWKSFLGALEKVLTLQPSAAGLLPPLGMRHAIELYQSLYWVARAAAIPIPNTDLIHITAAGWSAVPAAVAKAISATPVLLTEHGVYVREAYLGAIRAETTPSRVFVNTRLARGLTRLAYRIADLVAPVTAANCWWEDAFGVAPERIRVVHNGVLVPDDVLPAPRTSTVVSIGRVDPLKDIHTLLRVAHEVIRRVPEARFLHYGPVVPAQVPYAQSCFSLHRKLRLGDRFRFMGPTSTPTTALRTADVALITSISEGFPLAVLEAMAMARPVVATSVGGVAEGLQGGGLVAPSRDINALATAVTTLLKDPELAQTLGERGRQRVARRFTLDACLDGYRNVMDELMASPRQEVV